MIMVTVPALKLTNESFAGIAQRFDHLHDARESKVESTEMSKYMILIRYNIE